MVNVPSWYPRKNNHVQSILFPASIYSPAEASRIIKNTGYYDYGYDRSKNLLRYRQFNPDREKRFVIVKSVRFKGVMYVIQY